MSVELRSSRRSGSVGARLPDWAEGAFLGELFACGPWFRHFQDSALAANERPLYVESHRGAEAPRLVFPMKTRALDDFPWGHTLESMDNYYSCGFGPVCSAAPQRQDLDALCATAADVLLAYDVLRVAPIDRNDPFARSLWDALDGGRFARRWSLAFGNWFANVEGLDYAAYLKHASSTFPATCEKRRASFVRRKVGEMEIIQSPDDLERHIEAYEAVYRSSWKVQEAYPSFVPGLIRLAAARGWLRLGILRVSGEPAAAQLWFVVDGRALIYKVAYDERFGKLSVGSILTCEMIRHVIDEDRVTELDFLSGDDAYKAKWMFERRERHTLWAYNLARPRGAASYARHLAGQALARARRTLARAPGQAQPAKPDATTAP